MKLEVKTTPRVWSAPKQRPIHVEDVIAVAIELEGFLSHYRKTALKAARKRGAPSTFMSLKSMCHYLNFKNTGRNRTLVSMAKRILRKIIFKKAFRPGHRLADLFFELDPKSFLFEVKSTANPLTLLTCLTSYVVPQLCEDGYPRAWG